MGGCRGVDRGGGRSFSREVQDSNERSRGVISLEDDRLRAVWAEQCFGPGIDEILKLKTCL